MKIENFFSTLPPITDWMEIGSPSAYKEIPDDWWVLMTDLKGSTQALREGKYKQVNILGVCAIISVQNALETNHIPFIFGGDGATLFVSPDMLEKARQALSYTRSVAKKQFGFDLRVFSIEMKRINNSGKTVSVARLQGEYGQNTYLFRGGGITYCEKLMKESQDFELPLEYPRAGFHDGLECRWNPIPSERGTMISLIIRPLDETNAIEAILYNLQDMMLRCRPVQRTSIPISWPPKDLSSEMKAREKGFLSYIKVFLFTFLIWPILNLARNKEKSAVHQYLSELQENTDFLKRDDNLRLVLDLNSEERERLFKLLEKFKAQGLIKYGYHESPQALMTCMVKDTKDHFHFIDGSDGGYVKAAEMLKRQN